MAICEACHRTIVLGLTPDGKRIPLDPRAHVYRIVDGKLLEKERQDEVWVERLPYAVVAHISTCTVDKRFSVPQPDHRLASAGETADNQPMPDPADNWGEEPMRT